jgi:ketosteroid isomerase-like protein
MRPFESSSRPRSNVVGVRIPLMEVTMTRIARLALVVALASVAACSSRTGPQFDRSDVDNINKLIEQLRIAFNAKDAAKAAALYSTTGVVMPPNRALMRGRQFVQQYYDDRFAEGASDLEIQSADVSGAGDPRVRQRRLPAESGTESGRAEASRPRQVLVDLPQEQQRVAD